MVDKNDDVESEMLKMVVEMMGTIFEEEKLEMFDEIDDALEDRLEDKLEVKVDIVEVIQVSERNNRSRQKIGTDIRVDLSQRKT